MQLTNLHNRLIAEKAAEMGISCRTLIPGIEDILILDNGEKRIYINKTRSHKLPFIAGFLSTNKVATNLLLEEAGLPIPAFCLVQEVTEEAKQFIEKNAPIVVKPYNTNRGVGIVMNVHHQEELTAAVSHALNYSSHVILQKQVEGCDYRVLVIDKQIIGVLENRPPFIIGDGHSNIEELITQANRDPRRGSKDDLKPLMTIPIDEPLLLYLQSLNLDITSVLNKGKKLYVRLNSNDYTGGENIDCTDHICEENERIALDAAETLGIDVAGIDLRCRDISQPISQSEGGIIEVNALPGMDGHMIPSQGKPRDAIGAYLRYLFK